MANVPYLQAFSLDTQEIELKDTPQQVAIEELDEANEFSLDATTSIITYDKEGAARKFAYIITPQVGRKNVCKDVVPNFRCWLQFRASDSLEFVDVPNCNILMNVNTIRETKGVPALQGLITLEEGNELRIMMASNFDEEVQIQAFEKTGEPNIPSIIVNIFNIGLEKDEEPEP